MSSVCQTVNCLGALASSIVAQKRDTLAFMHIFDWTGAGSRPRVHIGFADGNRLSIELHPGRPISAKLASHLLSGVIPELLDSEMLTIGGVEGREDWVLANGHGLLTFDNLDSSVPYQVRTTGHTEGFVRVINPFGSNHLHPECSAFEAIVHRLSRTALGSPFRDRDHQVQWLLPHSSALLRVPGRPVVEEGENLSQKALLVPTEGVRGMLVVSSGLTTRELHLAKGGRLVHRLRIPKPLVAAIAREDLGCYAEVDWYGLHTAIDDSLVFDDNTEDLIREAFRAVEAAAADVDFIEFLEELKSVRLALQADDLERRKSALRSSRYVYVGDELMFHEPRSENDVVILLSKLEGRGALPFHLFTLLEYTPQQGIDAISNVRVFAEEQDDLLEPLECEYTFANFLAHEHPLEHVRYVICWSVGDYSTRGLERDGLNPWLYIYRAGGYHIRVFEMRSFPRIQIREADL